MQRAKTSGKDSDRLPRWHVAELRRPGRLFAFLVSLILVALGAQMIGCNVHELGHAVVGWMFGWEVESINLCLPAGGGVLYSDIPIWAWNAQGYAGGLVAAAFLLGVYAWVIARRSRPLQSPAWWAAGLGTVLSVGPQLVLAAMEGTRGPGEDYTDLFRDLPQVFVTLVVVSAAAGALIYAWRWRAVWRSPSP